MSIPSIENLIKNENSNSDLLSKNTKVKRKITEVNRKYEELQTAQRAKELGYEYISFKGFPLDVEAMALLEEKEAEEAKAIPFFHEGGLVRVGVVDPDTPGVAEIRKSLERAKYQVRMFIISPSSFREGLGHYAQVVRTEKLETEHIELSSQEINEKAEKFKQTILKEKHEILKEGTTELLAGLVSLSLKHDASDVHLESGPNGSQIRLRIDGVLQEQGEIAPLIHEKIVSRIKVLTNLKLNIATAPQEGSFSIKIDGQPVDLRVSILPSVFGESVVMLILRQREAMTLKQLGLNGLTKQRLEESFKKTTGMILTAGPTGSGKTTTLYAVLQILNKQNIKIITIEDPVEYKIPGISQTPIDKQGGMTFGNGLKSILRQEPDVVMIGEIRDQETAEVAVQAALVGHLMLSTLHSKDAVSIIPRLLDLNIKPFLIVSSINVAIAQRLVRKICQDCRKPAGLDNEIMAKVKKILEEIPSSAQVKLPSKLTFYQSEGCGACNNLGYKGRVGIFEAFNITPGMEKLILRQAPISELQKQAVEDGMVSLVQDGLLKALDGATDVYEVFRVAG